MAKQQTVSTTHSPSCASLRAYQTFCDCGYAERVKAEDRKPQTTKADLDLIEVILEIAVRVDGYPKEVLETFLRIREQMEAKNVAA